MSDKLGYEETAEKLLAAIHKTAAAGVSLEELSETVLERIKAMAESLPEIGLTYDDMSQMSKILAVRENKDEYGQDFCPVCERVMCHGHCYHCGADH